MTTEIETASGLIADAAKSAITAIDATAAESAARVFPEPKRRHGILSALKSIGPVHVTDAVAVAVTVVMVVVHLLRI